MRRLGRLMTIGALGNSGGTPAIPNSIELNGSGYITCGSDAGLDDLHGGSFTVEGWLLLPVTASGSKFIWNKQNAGSPTTGWTLAQYVSANNGLIASVKLATTDIGLTMPGVLVLGAWHHLAYIFNISGDMKLHIAVDGIIIASSDAGAGGADSDASLNFVIGAASAPVGYQPLANGARIGWHRVSDNARYTANFVPVSRLTPPDADGNTLAIWKVSEGEGTALDNAEGTAGRDGVITNGTWVYSP